MKLPPFLLERYYAAREFQARHQLSASDCESFSVSELLALDPEAKAQFMELRLGYTESLGEPGLRREIAGLYKTISPEQVLVHSGAEEVIHNFMNAVLQAGDHLVVQWPCYQSLYQIAQSQGCEVTPWQLKEKDGWQPRLSELEKLLNNRTKAVIINFPHNPSGSQASLDFLINLAELSQERGFVVFSDEVYRFLEYGSGDQTPPFCDLSPRSVSMGVMSKTFGLPGLRIGWMATGNQELMDKMAAYKDYTTICNSAPSEFLARLTLEHRHYIVKRNLGIISANLEFLSDFFLRHQKRFAWQAPQAGPIAFPRLEGGSQADSFCDEVFSKTGVLLLPGRVYGDDYAAHFRIGLGRIDFPQALNLLDSFLSD